MSLRSSVSEVAAVQRLVKYQPQENPQFLFYILSRGENLMGVALPDVFGFNSATPDSFIQAIQTQVNLYHVTARVPDLFH